MIHRANKIGEIKAEEMEESKQESEGVFEDFEQDSEEGDDFEERDEGEQGGSGAEMDAENVSGTRLAQNQLFVTLSYSLVSKIRQLARSEGVGPEDIVIELLSEGIARRGFEDSVRPAPSHLMTRTGYVPPEGQPGGMQPKLSHHSFGAQQNGRQNPQQGRRPQQQNTRTGGRFTGGRNNQQRPVNGNQNNRPNPQYNRNQPVGDRNGNEKDWDDSEQARSSRNRY